MVQHIEIEGVEYTLIRKAEFDASIRKARENGMLRAYQNIRCTIKEQSGI